jgi:peptidoglycan hydrolase-like protein with peptidoglycan-binding domain
MRKLILATASVLALGIAGPAITQAADMGNTAPAPGSAMSGAYLPQPAKNLSKNDIAWAQQQLRNKGLYNGPIDGALNLQTQHALLIFQKENGLTVTSTLDRPTMRSLHAITGLSGTSSPPRSVTPSADRTSGSMANPPLAPPDRPYPGGEGD